MKEEIKRMSNNIGSLVSFLKRRPDLVDEIDKNIPIQILESTVSEKIYYYLNDIKSIIYCSCGEKRTFIGFKNGHRSTCGNKKCFIRKRKETCIKKFGVDNPKKSKKILLKEKENILEKWGGSHYMNDQNVRSKFNKTMVQNHGVDWAQQSIDIKKKSRSSWEKNPNKERISTSKSLSMISKTDDEKKMIQLKRVNRLINNWGSVEMFYDHVSEKIKEKSLENYKVEHHLSHPDIIKKRIDTLMKSNLNKIKNSLPTNISFLSKEMNFSGTDSYLNLSCSKCNKDFTITRQYFHLRTRSNIEVCLNCNPVFSGKSNMENELYDFISEFYKGDILRNHRGITSEIDLYLPDLMIAFEFNGLFWHSNQFKEKNYHLNKTKDCLNSNISLIHIWEDNWIYKKDIIKSMILNKIGMSKKIGARKCTISEVSNKECREFLNRNHIQGFLGSKIKLGLYHCDELVSLMTFGNLRKPLGQSTKEGDYELLRFCNKLGYSIVGGASKLFSYFLKTYLPIKIISYSDSSRGIGSLYTNLGFYFIGDTDPNYYYIIDGIRKHRFNFRKDILVREGNNPNLSESKIMENKGIRKIFDCGSKKWEFINNI